tara:strand:+ start:120 stop:347 length:228 start_codon:yes stop_codon:yes gene_type:complete
MIIIKCTISIYMEISDEHKTKIKEILKSENDTEVLSHKLKLYLLEHSEYFSNLISGMDVTWLVKSIILNNKNKKA